MFAAQSEIYSSFVKLCKIKNTEITTIFAISKAKVKN
jgi:hypothetical protein